MTRQSDNRNPVRKSARQDSPRTPQHDGRRDPHKATRRQDWMRYLWRQRPHRPGTHPRRCRRCEGEGGARRIPSADGPASRRADVDDDWATTVLADWLLPASSDADRWRQSANCPWRSLTRPVEIQFDGCRHRLSSRPGSCRLDMVIRRRINELDLDDPAHRKAGNRPLSGEGIWVEDPQRLTPSSPFLPS